MYNCNKSNHQSDKFAYCICQEPTTVSDNIFTSLSVCMHDPTNICSVICQRYHKKQMASLSMLIDKVILIPELLKAYGRTLIEVHIM